MCQFTLCYFNVGVGVIFIAMALVMIHWIDYYSKELIGFDEYTLPEMLLLFGILQILFGVTGVISVIKPVLINGMIVLILCEIITGSEIISCKGYTKKLVRNNMKKLFVDYELLEYKSKCLVNKMQSNFKCCGIYYYTDWESKLEKNMSEIKLPPSCCKNYSLEVCKAYSNEKNHLLSSRVFTDGCYDKVSKEFDKYESTVVAVFFALLLIQIYCLASTLTLSRKYARNLSITKVM